MLFRPTAVVQKAFAPELGILAPPPLGKGLPCVMMQVRTGDSTIQSQGNDTDPSSRHKEILWKYRQIFSCAKLAAYRLWQVILNDTTSVASNQSHD